MSFIKFNKKTFISWRTHNEQDNIVDMFEIEILKRVLDDYGHFWTTVTYLFLKQISLYREIVGKKHVCQNKSIKLLMCYFPLFI